LEETDDVFEQDAFAFAGGADEDEGFAPADIEVDTLEDFLGIEAFVEAADLNERGRSGLRRWGCGHKDGSGDRPHREDVVEEEREEEIGDEEGE
jgi:hypothetical protein